MDNLANGNENKSGKKRAVIIILAVLAVILVCILLAMRGCTGGNDETSGTESGVQSENEGSDVLNGVHGDISDGAASTDATDSETSSEPSESDAASDADVSETSADISAESDASDESDAAVSADSPINSRPEESDSSASGDSTVNSNPDEESKPEESKEEPKPVEQPITEGYNTEWGTRPFEFEEVQDVYHFGMWGKPDYYSQIEEHTDRYHNTWYTYGGKIIGNGSIFYTGVLPQVHTTKYLGNGYWSNGRCWWKEGDSNIYDMPVITSFKITNPQILGMKDDMLEGFDMWEFWVLFIENRKGAQEIALECHSFEEFFEKEREHLKSYGDDFYEENKNHVLFNIEFYKNLNINSYKDLILAIADPFSYQFSKYTHEFN